MFESHLSSKREKLYVTPPQQGSGHSPPGPVRKSNIQDLFGWICVTTTLVSVASPFLQSCETPCGNRRAWLTSARQPPACHLRTRGFCERNAETKNESLSRAGIHRADGANVPVPVVCVFFGCVRSGVHVVSNQPVEILVTAYSQLLHLLLGDMQAICTEIPQNHNVLRGIGNGHFTTEKFH